ncbi:DUF4357 domain-containing protein [Streptomyces sp900116325]|uniref:DUF4357 domain-containing protein n=1 Tax=Streptomyces sp. 900116325 TaxID=3154295 RepID=UPI0033BDCC92
MVDGPTPDRHLVELDDEVYQALNRLRTPFDRTINEVLRRRYVKSRPSVTPFTGSRLSSSPAPSAARSGPGNGTKQQYDDKLRDLLADGRLRPGQRLVWRRPNSAKEYVAYVTADGRLRLQDGRTCDSPSGACQLLTGGSANGWKEWETEDGNPISSLRRS